MFGILAASSLITEGKSNTKNAFTTTKLYLLVSGVTT